MRCILRARIPRLRKYTLGGRWSAPPTSALCLPLHGPLSPLCSQSYKVALSRGLVFLVRNRRLLEVILGSQISTMEWVFISFLFFLSLKFCVFPGHMNHLRVLLKCRFWSNKSAFLASSQGMPMRVAKPQGFSLLCKNQLGEWVSALSLRPSLSPGPGKSIYIYPRLK